MFFFAYNDSNHLKVLLLDREPNEVETESNETDK